MNIQDSAGPARPAPGAAALPSGPARPAPGAAALPSGPARPAPGAAHAAARTPKPRRAARLLVPLARGLAFFLGIYTALSLFGLVHGGAYNANSWYIDLSQLAGPLALALQAVVAATLLLFSFKVPRRRLLRIAGAAVCALFALYAIQNAATVYGLASAGTIRMGFPLPFSLFVALAFIALAAAIFFGHRAAPWPDQRKQRGEDPSAAPSAPAAAAPDAAAAPSAPAAAAPAAAVSAAAPAATRHSAARPLVTLGLAALAVIVCGAVFALGQVACFGLTDYSRPVDAVVVLGAQVYPDGTPSPALAGRVDKAVELYQKGYTQTLVMSGGTGVEGVNEAVAMSTYAQQLGVPAAAIIVDPNGSSTQLTVANTLPIARQQGFKTLGVVSSYYHLARAKMLYLAAGENVLTVPADGAKEGPSAFKAALREIPGWWYYWFRGLF